MIFVSVGMERYPFDRLMRGVETLAPQLGQEPLIVQGGASAYQPRGCVWHRVLPYHALVRHLQEARVVILHAGVGSLLLCRQQGKVPIVVPRCRRFGEHVDDHQVELARRLHALGHVVLSEDPMHLATAVRAPEAKERVISGAPHLTAALDAWLRSCV